MHNSVKKEYASGKSSYVFLRFPRILHTFFSIWFNPSRNYKLECCTFCTSFTCGGNVTIPYRKRTTCTEFSVASGTSSYVFYAFFQYYKLERCTFYMRKERTDSAHSVHQMRLSIRFNFEQTYKNCTVFIRNSYIFKFN